MAKSGRRYSADVICLTSTNVTKSASKAIEFGEITQNKGYITPLKVIQGHRCRYQWKDRMRLSINGNCIFTRYYG